MKKLIVWLVIAALGLTACACASAATGDRTLIHLISSDGYMDSYITNLFRTDDGIYVILNGQQSTIRVYRDGAQDYEEYVMDEAAFSPQEVSEEETYSYTQNAGWFAWKGGLYVIQYKTIQSADGSGSEIEGGFVKQVKLQDGQILLEDSDIPQLDWEDMIEDYGDWKNSRYLSKIMVSGDSVIASTWDNNGQSMLMVFDLTTGGSEEIPVAEMNDVFAGPEGSVLMCRYEWGEQVQIHLIQFELASQSEEILYTASADGQFQGVCWDEAAGTLYYVLDGELWKAQGLGMDSAEAVSDCPLSYNIDMVPLGDGRVLMWSQNAAVIRNTDPAAKTEGFILRIQDFAYGDTLSETIYDYSDAQPDVTVILKRGGTASTILQDMMNRESQTDIYTLTYDSSEFDALRNRGFLADLGGNSTLAAATERMNGFAQNALKQNDRLIAVPVSMNGYTIGIRREIWEKIGGTEEELPKTWAQFFDWIMTLQSKVEGTEYAAFDTWMTRENFRSSLISILLNQYQAYIDETGRDYAFNTPLLRGLLEKLDALDYDALNLPEENYEEGDGGMISYEYHQPLLEFYSTVTLTTWGDGSEPLALAMEDGAGPIMPLTLTVAFVNPYSQHAEAATEYLAMTLKNMSTVTRYSLFTDQTEPIRDPYYEENKKNMLQWMEEAKKSLEAADEEERAMWETTVQTYEEELANIDSTSWLISEKAIAAYRQRTEWIRVLEYDFVNSMFNSESDASNYYEMLWGYAQGQVSAEELLSAIDKKVQMMRLEGN